MKVSSTVTDILDVQTDLLCCFTTTESPDIPGLDDAAVQLAAQDVAGRLKYTATVPCPGKAPSRIMVVGLGSESKITADTIRDASGMVAKMAQNMRLKQFALACPPESVAEAQDAAAHMVEGSTLALYAFDKYKSKKADPQPDLVIVSAVDVSDQVQAAQITAESVVYTRSVANLPANDCPPSVLADLAKEMARSRDVTCTVLSVSELADQGFGGIMAVGKGSVNAPRLIVLEYRGGPKGQAPVALVGKAVTFDTGGISLKPRSMMDEMKFDKCGGCTVLGIMRAVADLHLPCNVVGLIPSVENMPGGGSYRPGDIIRLYNGKTAEILNTDAEGRLILADALAYAEKTFSPQGIIDLATLTGACIVALGCNVAGLISSDDSMASFITESGERTAERVWRLPLDDDYMDMIKSDVADIRNLGMPRNTGTAAGTVTAAAFLRYAIDKTPWSHLDIAGTAWMQAASKKRSYNPSGATGFGVRLILDYLKHLQ